MINLCLVVVTIKFKICTLVNTTKNLSCEMIDETLCLIKSNHLNDTH